MVMEIILVPICKALKRASSKGSSWIKVSNHYLEDSEIAFLKCSKIQPYPKVSTTGVIGDSSSKSRNLWRLIFQVSQTPQNMKYGLVHFFCTQQRESMVPANNSVIHSVKKVFAF